MFEKSPGVALTDADANGDTIIKYGQYYFQRKPQLDGVQSVRGTLVDNTDPANPIIKEVTRLFMTSAGVDSEIFVQAKESRMLSDNNTGDYTLIRTVLNDSFGAEADGEILATVDTRFSAQFRAYAYAETGFDDIYASMKVSDSTNLLSAELKLTYNGLIFPTKTEAQRTAIASPVVGLHVYQTDGTRPGLWEYKSTGWVYIPSDSEKADKNISIKDQTASYTLVLADAGKLIRQNVGTANTVTIPANASVAFPIGTQISVSQAGAGQTTLTPATGVTINSPGSATKTRVQFSTAKLVKTGADVWLLSGDIAV